MKDPGNSTVLHQRPTTQVGAHTPCSPPIIPNCRSNVGSESSRFRSTCKHYIPNSKPLNSMGKACGRAPTWELLVLSGNWVAGCLHRYPDVWCSTRQAFNRLKTYDSVKLVSSSRPRMSLTIKHFGISRPRPGATLINILTFASVSRNALVPLPLITIVYHLVLLPGSSLFPVKDEKVVRRM